ncbi:hypothetical protein ACQ4PT_041703 [Festuca glaucescens]
METSQSCNALAAAAAGDDYYPRWVMFVDNDRHRCESQANPCPSSTDAKTVAQARTSNGLPVRASFRLAAPPAVSQLTLNLDDGLPDRLVIYHHVVAAHGDSVLLSMSVRNMQQQYRNHTTDHFVYRSGDGTDRLPSLSLLPPCYLDEKNHDRTMKRRRTGILRRGDGEFVVATDLKMNIIGCEDGSGVKRAEAEFHQLLSSDLEWKTKLLPVRRHDANKGEICFGRWESDRVIPVADRFFYWVDLCRGIIFSDVSEESTELRFVPLPVEPTRDPRDKDLTRNLCATDGGAAVKFVEVSPRCCCGDPGVTTCAASRQAFTITTWTLRSTLGGDMGWEKDGVVDSSEIWALDAYRCLPRLRMEYPVVSIDDTNVVVFFLPSPYSRDRDIRVSGDKTWVVMINMRTKSLIGSAPIISDEQHYRGEVFLPSQASSYFNTSPGSRNDTPPANERRRRKDIGVPRAVASVIELAIDYVASPYHEILAALQEIPRLTRDEMLRAYGVLACDDRRRYRTLVALPMDMRKDYCCMLLDMGTNKQMH